MNHQGLAAKRLHRIVAFKALATCLGFCLTCLPKFLLKTRFRVVSKCRFLKPDHLA